MTPDLVAGPHVRRAVEVMGTVFSIDVVTTDRSAAEDVIDDLVSWWWWVDATFSTYRRDSVVSRLARGETDVPHAPPQVRHVLDLCVRMERRTDGYFTARATGHVDPTGLVKGWSVAEASARLTGAGLVNHCINGGGDIQAHGRPAPDRPWSLAIADPRDKQKVLEVVHGEEIALATSGVAERGAHIIDPFTGRPADALLSVSVAGPNVVVADGYATAAVAMGDAAKSWLERVARKDGYEALVVDRAGVIWRTAGWFRLT
jgi:thiamine biosynthesis lipoprotein